MSERPRPKPKSDESDTEGPVSWAKVYKIVRQAGHGGMAVYAIAEKLKLKKGDKQLEKTIQQLVRQGRASLATGGYKGMMCRYVIPIEINEREKINGKSQPDKSKREKVGDAESPKRSKRSR